MESTIKLLLQAVLTAAILLTARAELFPESDGEFCTGESCDISDDLSDDSQLTAAAGELGP